MVLKGDYGWDRPQVIRTLFITAIGAVAGGGILFEIFDHFSANLAWFFLWAMMGIGGLALIGAYLMISSSKRGKFRVLAHLADELGLKGNEQVLDIGCKRGALTATIAKRLNGGKVIGVDFWKGKHEDFDMRQNLHIEGIDHKVELEEASFPKLPMGDESFDCVVSSFNLHRFPKRKKVVQEIVRVLRKGGKVGIVDTGHIGEYRKELEHLGLTCTQHGPSWLMLPPVTTLIGRKS